MTKRRRPRADDLLAVRSNVDIPVAVLPWERDLLLPHVKKLVDAVLEEPANDQEARDQPSCSVRPRINR
jgi:hypothetical protein